MNTGDDWQKSQWLPPRLAQGTMVIRQVSYGRRRVGEFGEDRSRLSVEQNVFSRALGATPFKGSSASQAVRHQSCVFSCEFDLTIVVAVAQRAEMLHTFPSMKNSGGRRPCSAQPDRTGCIHPPQQARSQTRNYVLLYRAIRRTAYLQSSPHGKRKIWESGQCAIREETRGFTERPRLDLHVSVGAFWGCNDISSWIGARNKGAVLEHDRHSCKEFRVEYL